MGFLYGFIFFVVGIFSFFQLLGCVFVALPNDLLREKELVRLKNKYLASTFIHLIIATIVIVLMIKVLDMDTCCIFCYTFYMFSF